MVSAISSLGTTISGTSGCTLDAIGHPRSEGTKVIEKYRRPDYGHLQTELTFDDPTLYTKPFTVKINYEIVTDNDIFEMFCGQNEKDRQHMVTGPTSMVTEK